MVENLLAIVAVAGAAFVVTLLAGVLFSERVRHRGLGKLTPVEFELAFAPHTSTAAA